MGLKVVLQVVVHTKSMEDINLHFTGICAITTANNAVCSPLIIHIRRNALEYWPTSYYLETCVVDNDRARFVVNVGRSP